MIGKDISWVLVASVWKELLEERSASYPPSWAFSMPAGTTAWTWDGPTLLMR